MANPTARPAQRHQEYFSMGFDVASAAATTSHKIWGSAERVFRIDRVWYNNPTGLTDSATDYFVITVTDGTTALATWSTLTGADGALSADTPVTLRLSADADLAANKTLTVTLTLHGTQTLPAGRIVISGHVL